MSKHEPEHTEIVAVFAMLAWGAWLCSPFWDTFASFPVFRQLAEIAPEQVWGAAMVVGGLFRAAFLFRDGQLWKLRLAVTTFSMLVWSMLAVLSFSGSLSSPAGVLYATLVFVEFFTISDLFGANHGR